MATEQGNLRFLKLKYYGTFTYITQIIFEGHLLISSIKEEEKQRQRLWNKLIH